MICERCKRIFFKGNKIDIDLIHSLDRKYVERRYDIFQKFDDCMMSREAMYETKAEAIAIELSSMVTGSSAFDVFSGVGGLSIAMAARGIHVTSNDVCPGNVYAVCHNATVHGVTERIETKNLDVKGLDLFWLVRNSDCIVLDPPWNGNAASEYLKEHSFSFENFGKTGVLLRKLIARALTKQILLLAPSNFDVNQASGLGRKYTTHWFSTPNRQPIMCFDFFAVQ